MISCSIAAHSIVTTPSLFLTKENQMLDEKRWNNLVKRLSGNLPRNDSFSRVMAAYSESHRYYHNFSHIIHCLSQFDEVKELIPITQ